MGIVDGCRRILPARAPKMCRPSSPTSYLLASRFAQQFSLIIDTLFQDYPSNSELCQEFATGASRLCYGVSVATRPICYENQYKTHAPTLSPIDRYTSHLSGAWFGAFGAFACACLRLRLRFWVLLPYMGKIPINDKKQKKNKKIF